ncbi:hypothetical protein ABTM14_19965, partial [Acinetobacter baumannii]
MADECIRRSDAAAERHHRSPQGTGLRCRRSCIIATEQLLYRLKAAKEKAMSAGTDRLVNLLGQAAMDVWGDMPRDIQ